MQNCDIKNSKRTAKSIGVSYSKQMPRAFGGPFLKEEREFLEGIAAVIFMILKQKEDVQNLIRETCRFL